MRLPRNIWVPIAVHAGLFVLVVLGVLPRAVVPFWAVAAAAWAAVVRTEVAVTWFVAVIPFFVAIPITTDFDNFNTWRPVALVIAVRWFLSTQSWQTLAGTVRRWMRRPHTFPVASLLAALAGLALLSVTQAADQAAALRRGIYLANALLVPAVAYAAMVSGQLRRRWLLASLAWSAIGVTAVAFLQLGSTYLMDVYAFMRLWGEQIQLRQYGAMWSQIAVWVGNTWLAYYGPQLSLRAFSVFPDSHSFPMYTLMALGGIVALTLRPVWDAIGSGASRLRELLRTRVTLGVVWLPLGLLAVILSGTRGIWAASVGLVLVIGVLVAWMRRRAVPPSRRLAFGYVSSWLVVYLALFAVAWPIFVSPQFLLAGGGDLFADRLRSIIDLGETSNAIRLAIWDATVGSIGQHPWLGVGIGNFPTVLGQHVILAKAGSSAHNVWLHVAAEIGVIGFICFCALWGVLYRSAWEQYARFRDGPNVLFAAWMLLVIPWLAAYLLTDSALFDARVLMLFGVVGAMLRAPEHA